MDLKLKTALFLAVAGVALAGCSETPDDGGDNGDMGGNVVCPEGTTDVDVLGETHCQLSGTITEDVTLTAGNFYQLSGPVFVGEDVGAEGTAGDPAVLTIEPGVQVYGQEGQSFLTVSRGSQLIAEGTEAEPIIFTSAEDLGFAPAFGRPQRAIFTGASTEDPNTAEWGGLVLNGSAPLNVGLETQGEGGSGLYGGTNPADNSGVLRYVQIKYAGFRQSNEDELNGLAFQGTGSGTTVEFVQVHNGQDDGIEFFGGTTDAKRIIVTGAGDDSIDWTQGWSGKVQFALVVQNPNQPEGADRGIEADNLEQDNDALPRATPQLANATFVGAAPLVGDTGIVLRRGTAGNYANIVISNFRDASFDIDNQATYNQVAEGTLTLNSTLLGNVTVADPLEVEDDDVANDLAGFFASDENNVITAPTLNGFFNGPAEQAVAAFDVAGLDADFFEPVPWIGAVNGDASNFTAGWSFGLNEAPACPDDDAITSITDEAGTVTGCNLTGTITSNVRLQAGLDYFLTGPVFVGVDSGADAANPAPGANSATMTVDAGVTVQGLDPQSFLTVTRGSELFVNGTAANPVTFTAAGENLDIQTSTALWGGLVVNGRAVLNVGLETQGEGGSGLYGGNDDADSSGAIRFLRVLYAGNRVSNDDELNGVAFQGTGSGTIVENLQIHNAQDDGIEFFGGTTNVTNLVVTGAGDDSVDWTQGWSGKIQFGVVVQNENNPEGADRGIEADNLEQDNDALPRATPQLVNMTFVGGAPTIGDTGIVLRRGTAGNYANIVVANFRDASFDIDNDATYAQVAAGALTLNSTLLGNVTPADALESEDDDVANDLAGFFASDANNIITAPTLVNGFCNGAAEQAVAPFDATTLDADFFRSVPWIGAVNNDATNFTAGWTVFLGETCGQ